MICIVCGSTNKWHWVKQYREADKYEQYCGIGPYICRRWYKCLECGVYRAERNYQIDKLSQVYTNGYRDPGFRGESIQEAFEHTMAIPWGESENVYRTRWLQDRLRRNADLLDVGAGIGVFPYVMRIYGHRVAVVEPNKESIDFMRSRGILCFQGLFQDISEECGKWDVVSMVHVLEHIEDPEDFLGLAKNRLNKGGSLFLEVPDAVEFEYLPDDHDDFCSCHIHFFDAATLYRLIEGCGFRVTDIHRVRHKKRDLSRILMLAKC